MRRIAIEAVLEAPAEGLELLQGSSQQRRRSIRWRCWRTLVAGLSDGEAPVGRLLQDDALYEGLVSTVAESRGKGAGGSARALSSSSGSSPASVAPRTAARLPARRRSSSATRWTDLAENTAALKRSWFLQRTGNKAGGVGWAGPPGPSGGRPRLGPGGWAVRSAVPWVDVGWRCQRSVACRPAPRQRQLPAGRRVAASW